MRTGTFYKLLLILVLAMPAAAGFAQSSSGFGTIDEVMQDDGYIVIDGKRLVFDSGDVVITYNGEKMRSSFLSPGLSVRYSTDSEGKVKELVLIGPARILDQINNQ